MVAITRLLFLAATVAASTIVSRDVFMAERDINQKIGPQLTALNNRINEFPASGDAGTKSIRDAFTTLSTTLDETVEDIKDARPIVEEDGTTLLADIVSLLPILRDTLDAAGARAPSWAAVEGGTTQMRKDLESLSEAFDEFTIALISGMSADLVENFRSIRIEISRAFETAIAAYSV